MQKRSGCFVCVEGPEKEKREVKKEFLEELTYYPEGFGPNKRTVFPGDRTTKKGRVPFQRTVWLWGVQEVY